MKDNEFYGEILNFTDKKIYDPIYKKKIPPKKIVEANNSYKFAKSLKTLLETQNEEIGLWIEIFEANKADIKKSIIIRMAIMLEYFIFCTNCLTLANKINYSIKKLKGLHKIQRSFSGLPNIDTKELIKIKISLADFRNKISAHRYTTKNNTSLSFGAIMKLYGKINENILYSTRDSLLFYFKEIENWILKYGDTLLLVGHK